MHYEETEEKKKIKENEEINIEKKIIKNNNENLIEENKVENELNKASNKINNDKKEIKNKIIEKEKNKINFNNEDIKTKINENSSKITENYNISINNESNNFDLKNQTKRKIQKKYIDLNAINDLSYKQGQSAKSKNSALDNYQSIFGLMPSKQNETALLLAPKHTKNKDLKRFDLNFNTEQMNNTNQSNITWNKYSCQYEDDKHLKDL